MKFNIEMIKNESIKKSLEELQKERTRLFPVPRKNRPITQLRGTDRRIKRQNRIFLIRNQARVEFQKVQSYCINAKQQLFENFESLFTQNSIPQKITDVPVVPQKLVITFINGLQKYIQQRVFTAKQLLDLTDKYNLLTTTIQQFNKMTIPMRQSALFKKVFSGEDYKQKFSQNKSTFRRGPSMKMIDAWDKMKAEFTEFKDGQFDQDKLNLAMIKGEYLMDLFDTFQKSCSKTKKLIMKKLAKKYQDHIDG